MNYMGSWVVVGLQVKQIIKKGLCLPKSLSLHLLGIFFRLENPYAE